MNWLFVAGGTGGHIYPAITIADHLKTVRAEDRIQFLTTSKPLDQSIIEQAGYAYVCLDGKGFKQKNIFEKIQSVLNALGLLFKTLRFIQTQKIDVVVGIGGYMSAPALLAGFLTRKKTASLEPNVTPGLSNRLVGKFVDYIFLAFEESASFFNQKKTVTSGNPIRSNIMKILPPTFKQKKFCVLIFGGSQGAMQINDLVIASLATLKQYEDKICFIHQTGKQGYENVKSAYAKYGFEHQVYEYIHAMDQAYQQSDFIIARAGSSVLEIAACGRPSILIPYPYAADNHQCANADVLSQRNAAFVLNGKNIHPDQLIEYLDVLINEPDTRVAMRTAALSLRKDNAANKIIETLTAGLTNA